MRWLWKGGEGPKDIPDWAYTFLVLTLHADPDRLGACKFIEQLDYFEKRPVLLFRIFDSDPKKEGEIKEFASLDRYPERILYEGYLELAGGKIVISPPVGSSSENRKKNLDF